MHLSIKNICVFYLSWDILGIKSKIWVLLIYANVNLTSSHSHVCQQCERIFKIATSRPISIFKFDIFTKRLRGCEIEWYEFTFEKNLALVRPSGNLKNFSLSVARNESYLLHLSQPRNSIQQNNKRNTERFRALSLRSA